MDFMERARRGMVTSETDEDIGVFLDAMERAHGLCERFNVPCTPWSERKATLEELFPLHTLVREEGHPGGAVRPGSG